MYHGSHGISPNLHERFQIIQTSETQDILDLGWSVGWQQIGPKGHNIQRNLQILVTPRDRKPSKWPQGVFVNEMHRDDKGFGYQMIRNTCRGSKVSTRLPAIHSQWHRLARLTVHFEEQFGLSSLIVVHAVLHTTVGNYQFSFRKTGDQEGPFFGWTSGTKAK